MDPIIDPAMLISGILANKRPSMVPLRLKVIVFFFEIYSLVLGQLDNRFQRQNYVDVLIKFNRTIQYFAGQYKTIKDPRRL